MDVHASVHPFIHSFIHTSHHVRQESKCEEEAPVTNSKSPSQSLHSSRGHREESSKPLYTVSSENNNNRTGKRMENSRGEAMAGFLSEEVAFD